jgi:dihydrofolate reductase
LVHPLRHVNRTNGDQGVAGDDLGRLPDANAAAHTPRGERRRYHRRTFVYVASCQESVMQPVTVDFIISLDGYGAAEGWPGFWGMEGPEYLAWLANSPEKDDTVLMGANTYRLMSGFAEAGEEEGMAELTAARKVVFSSTLRPPLTWANTRLVTADAVEAVRAMKDSSDRPMRTLGSVSLCRSLLRAGLVDRYRVVVFPVITGATGRDRIFDGYPDVRLELVESRLFDGRLQLLEYVPTPLDGPPGAEAR